MSRGKIKEFPFDRNGNLMHYPETEYTYDNYLPVRWLPTWMEVEPFQATLWFDHYSRGRSAAYVVWRDRDGVTYPMFIKQLSELILSTNIYEGVVFATWEIVKRGQNYGIRWVDNGTVRV